MDLLFRFLGRLTILFGLIAALSLELFGDVVVTAYGAHRGSNAVGGETAQRKLLDGFKGPSNIHECIGQLKWMYERLGRYTQDEIVEVLTTDREAIQIEKDCVGAKDKNADYFHGLDFVDELRGWAVGWNGRILHTDDGGVTWKPQVSGTVTHFLSADFVDTQTGWAVGHNGLVLKTTDGGENWQRQAVLGNVELNKISCASRMKCWIATQFAGEIPASSDGGKIWVRQKTGATGVVKSVFFLDDEAGWSVTRKGEFLRTVDGGKTWQISMVSKGSDLWDIHFIDRSSGWAVGTDGVLFSSHDGGKTWQDQSALLSHLASEIGLGGFDFRAVRFNGPDHGWIAGLKGLVLATGDGGKNWYAQSYSGNNTFSLYAISAVSPDQAWVSGNMGHIAVTLDGGANWVLIHGLSHLLSKRAWRVLTDKDEDIFVAGAEHAGSVCCQMFSNSWRVELMEFLAHLVDHSMRRICGGATAGFRLSAV